jgi:hypothetical protein
MDLYNIATVLIIVCAILLSGVFSMITYQVVTEH